MDPLIKVLLESKEKGKGVTIHVSSGETIPLIIMDVGDHLLTGRNQTSSLIVIRLEHVIALSTAF